MLFCARSAPFSAPLTLRSHAVVLGPSPEWQFLGLVLGGYVLGLGLQWSNYSIIYEKAEKYGER